MLERALLSRRSSPSVGPGFSYIYWLLPGEGAAVPDHRMETSREDLPAATARMRPRRRVTTRPRGSPDAHADHCVPAIRSCPFMALAVGRERGDKMSKRSTARNWATQLALPGDIVRSAPIAGGDALVLGAPSRGPDCCSPTHGNVHESQCGSAGAIFA